MPNLTKIAAWAASLGISRQQGYEAVKRCGITVIDGQVDAEYATVLYHRHTRVRAKDGAGDVPGALDGKPDQDPATGTDYNRQRARREAAEASMAEMKQAEMEGKYLIKDEVDAALFKVARSMRDGLTNCAMRIAADVASLTTVEECEAVIDREHRALLASMSHELKFRVGGTGEPGAEGEQQ